MRLLPPRSLNLLDRTLVTMRPAPSPLLFSPRALQLRAAMQPVVRHHPRGLITLLRHPHKFKTYLCYSARLLVEARLQSRGIFTPDRAFHIWHALPLREARLAPQQAPHAMQLPCRTAIQQLLLPMRLSHLSSLRRLVPTPVHMRAAHPPPLCFPSTLHLCATYLCELPLQLYFKAPVVLQLLLLGLQSTPLFSPVWA